MNRSLREIAIEAGTDKEVAHSYADAYERHLRHLRDRPIRLLEIGVGGYADPQAGGASLRMWKAYFPNAEIVGIDIEDKAALAEDRITILRGDQSDLAFLADVVARFGPFDVIVDDGSHINAHVITTFHALFGALADDGIYVIEDLQTAYWERTYGGSSTDDRDETSMTMLHGLVDGLNYAELDVPNYTPTEFDRGIVSLTFYHNLAFIQKGGNDEPSNFLPPHPRPSAMMRAKRRQVAEPVPSSTIRSVVRRLVPAPVRAAIRRRIGRSRTRR